MGQIIAIVIGIIVFIVGLVIYHIGLQILDEGDYFFYAVGFFLALFAIAGIALYFLLPRPAGQAHLTSLAPGRILQKIADVTAPGLQRAVVFSDNELTPN